VGHDGLVVDPTVIRKRRLVAVSALGAVAAAAVLGGALVGAHDGSSRADERPHSSGSADRGDARPPAQLPGGGRRLFPERRVVAFYGNPRDEELGALGIGTPKQAARRLLKQAAPYDRKSRRVLPAMELISTVATADAGPAGLYRDHLSFAKIRSYLKAARAAKALLVLDIQPGRGQFGPEIERLKPFHEQPDVGLALDPEWHVGPGQLPGKVIGSTDADVVNAAAAYLAKIVHERDLPEKLLVVHRFTDNMIARADRLAPVPGVQTVVNVDGFGSNTVKIAKYKNFVASTPRMRRGFKLFYKEDVKTMTPRQVMGLSPRPDVVVYE
jgi:hypothetical protein